MSSDSVTSDSGKKPRALASARARSSPLGRRGCVTARVTLDRVTAGASGPASGREASFSSVTCHTSRCHADNINGLARTAQHTHRLD